MLTPVDVETSQGRQMVAQIARWWWAWLVAGILWVVASAIILQFDRRSAALVGIVLVLVAIYFLFWNEGRAIQTYRALVEGAGLVVSIDSSKIDTGIPIRIMRSIASVNVAEAHSTLLTMIMGIRAGINAGQ